MPALDCLLAPGQSVRPRETPTAAASAAPGAKPFDELMTQALSPDETDAPRAAEAKEKNIADHSSPRRVHARPADHEAASPTANAPETAEKTTEAKTTDEAMAEVAISQGETVAGQTEVEVLPGLMIPLIPALPTMAFPLFRPTGEEQMTENAEATPAGTKLTATETVGQPAAAAVLTVGDGKSKSAEPSAAKPSPVTPLNPTGTESTQPLNASEPLPQKSATAVNDLATGKTNGAEAVKSVSQLAAAQKVSEAASAGLMASSVATETAETDERPVQLPDSLFSKSAAANAETLAPAQSEIHGTAAAKLYSAMNKPEKTTKAADSTEKVLPGSASLAAKENILPTSSALTGESITMLGATAKEFLSMDATTAANGVAGSALEGLRSKALERTHDMVALHAIRLGEFKSDSLHVVIKPGAGLQLSLNLQQGSEGINAQMKLERGDFGQLNQHWPELQQRLEERGIRLAPLTGSENSFAGGGSEFRQPQREFTNPDPAETSAFAEFALASSILQPITSSAVFASSGRGWESWA